MWFEILEEIDDVFWVGVDFVGGVIGVEIDVCWGVVIYCIVVGVIVGVVWLICIVFFFLEIFNLVMFDFFINLINFLILWIFIVKFYWVK